MGSGLHFPFLVPSRVGFGWAAGQARPLRIGIPGSEYHVTSRGLERRVVVRDDTNRKKWLSLLGEVADRREWRVLAWALMDNHFHVFVRTPAADISAGMHDLNSGYASILNCRHARCRLLFQSRFKGIIVGAPTVGN